MADLEFFSTAVPQCIDRFVASKERNSHGD
jgi:hypothetical protein